MEYAEIAEPLRAIKVTEQKPSRAKLLLDRHTYLSASEGEKLEQLASWLVEASESLGEEIIGGYSDEVAVVAGHVVVASVDDGGYRPILEIYEKDFAIQWHDAIAEYLTDPEVEWETQDIVYAVNESRPNEE